MASATPGRKGRTGRSSPGTRWWYGTESLRIPNRHDTGSTSPRSVGEVALIWDTISHYSPVLIAPLANFIAPARRKKNKRSGLGVAGRAADKIRSRDQSDNSEGAWPRSAGNAARPRRRGDRMSSRREFITV